MTNLTDYSPIQVTNGMVKRESDKAILAEVVTGRGNIAEVWFPKSQIVRKGTVMWVKSWLVEKKSREIGGLITLNRDIAEKIG